jgi:dipeptidyl aminopeptidase/acylaminoacyl peptidase
MSNARAIDAHEFTAGDKVALKPGNGLVALDVTSAGDILSVEYNEARSAFGAAKLTGLGSGRNIRLIELPAGEYRWSRVNLPFNYYLRVRNDARFHFIVVPGQITYAGSLAVQASGRAGNYAMSVVNRSAQIMIDLDRAFPGMRAQFGMEYRGAFPDRFVPFAQHEFGEMLAIDALKAGDTQPVTIARADVAEDLRYLIDELFAPPNVTDMRIGPAGDLVARSEYHDGKHHLVLLDPLTQQSVEVYEGNARISEMRWAGPHTLLVDLAVVENGSYVVHADVKPGAAPTFALYGIPGRGMFVGAVGNAGQALYTHATPGNNVHIYRIETRGTKFDGVFDDAHRVDRGVSNAFYGLTDGAGVLRVALTLDDGHYQMMYRNANSNSWTLVHTFDADQVFEPVLLGADGQTLYVKTNEGRPQTDLVRMTLPDVSKAETVFTVPGRDVQGVLTRHVDRSLVGVLSSQDGVIGATYLDQADRSLYDALSQQLAGKHALLYDRSDDGKRTLIYAYDENDPGAYYFHDADNGQMKLLASSKAPMPHVSPVHSTPFRVKVADGVDVESYLTLPTHGVAPYPLIVMPHGGPIGVGDAIQFDPIVQLLANRGYAVLRINYRGSGGYGRDFQQAGLGAWGKGIEDDVLAAIDAVLKDDKIDKNRVALRGSSYGGYSTLMGLIRTPQRFRCGVAISAVTDIPLMFSSSDWAPYKDISDQMKKIVGDPAASLNEMEAVSPDYLYRGLTQPLLIIHGVKDVRVPIEHALRLVMLLGHAQKPPQTVFLANSGHSIYDAQDRFRVEAAADRFFSVCLGKTTAH